MTWAVIGAVSALVFIAGVDALRSSGTETAGPSSASTTTDRATAVPTATAPATAETEGSLAAWQEIVQTGNEWAPLFAGDRHWAAPGTCRYMTQPACARIFCQRVGGITITNCMPPSWAFRKSFADATVQAIEIKGDQAGARFSNGEVVVLIEVGGGAWWIHELGGKAARQFFNPG
jgi:hypothetical protein